MRPYIPLSILRDEIRDLKAANAELTERLGRVAAHRDALKDALTQAPYPSDWDEMEAQLLRANAVCEELTELGIRCPFCDAPGVDIDKPEAHHKECTWRKWRVALPGSSIGVSDA